MCAGGNGDGQLGHGAAFFASTSPVDLTSTFTQVSAGGYHTCGLLPRGILVCWGKVEVCCTCRLFLAYFGIDVNMQWPWHAADELLLSYAQVGIKMDSWATAPRPAGPALYIYPADSPTSPLALPILAACALMASLRAGVRWMCVAYAAFHCTGVGKQVA